LAGGVPPADLVELGVVRGAYGVKGWLHVQPYSEQAEALRSSRHWWLLGTPPTPLEVTAVRRHGAALVAKWRSCDSPEEAERLRGMRVGVSRGEFPPGGDDEVYWVDLIGARVVNRGGVELGIVEDVLSSGAQDLLEVRRGEKVFLVPLVGRHVDEIDLTRRQISVDWEVEW
jgi:16S rRNA processing protein RimM